MEMIVLSLGWSFAAVLAQLLDFIEQRGLTAHGSLQH
jgi:hypothetical protein